MSDRIFPQLDQISLYKDPLSNEMIDFIKYLDSKLIKDIQLYVRPYLNDDNPDLVIYNPNKGIMFYNDLSWKPNSFKQSQESKKIRNPHGHGTIQVQSRIFTNNNTGEKIADPIKHIKSLLDNLVHIYVPEIGKKLKNNYRKNCHVGLLAPHFNSTNKAMSEIRVPKHEAIIIGNDYNKIISNHIIPYLNKEPKKWQEWEKEWTKMIKFFLVPPLHKIEDGIKIKLSSEQKKNVDHAPKTHRRLRGAAGSGKTLVIAQKAANIASNNKKVLVVTFNITLMQYILDQIKRATYRFEWENISIKHFHGFCSEFLNENGIPWPSSKHNESEEETKYKLDDLVPKLVSDTLKRGQNNKNRIYDAIIIDEGQDFMKSWYDCLSLFLSKNDEVFYVADPKQNLYERENRWIDQMKGGGKFNKRWREINRTYRFPKLITKKVNCFAKEFLQKDDSPLIDEKWELMSLFDPHIVWKNFEEDKDLNNSILKILEILTKEKKIHLEDIVILVPTHKEGNKIAKFLEKNKIGTINHIFVDKNRSNIRKYAFRMDLKGLKMSTLNSFKGWEVPTVLLITPTGEKLKTSKVDQLVYTGLTRSRSNLIVLNRNIKYAQYGEGWPSVWI